MYEETGAPAAKAVRENRSHILQLGMAPTGKQTETWELG
jgi:hypothetical protein